MNDRRAAFWFAVVSLLGAPVAIGVMHTFLPSLVSRPHPLTLTIAAAVVVMAVWGFAHLPFYVLAARRQPGRFFSQKSARRVFWTSTIWLNGLWATIGAAFAIGERSCFELMFALWFANLARVALAARRSLDENSAAHALW